MLEGLCVAGQACPYEDMSNAKRPSRPRDSNQLARFVADIATGEIVDPLMTEDGRDVAAVVLGRRGGLKGGVARREALTPARRSEIAKRAATARWSKK